MAEGWLRAMHGDRIDAESAGTRPGSVNRLAARVMHEAGVDLSSHRSKHVSELIGEPFDLVVTVCDSAAEACPVFPGRARVIHRAFDDPPALVSEARSDEEALPVYRRVRDEIGLFVRDLPRLIEGLV